MTSSAKRSAPEVVPEIGSSGASLRRSDRVSMELPIEIGGSDARGTDFFEAARTVVLSRHGAKIECRRILSPGQEVLISCASTKKEAPARIVGELGKLGESRSYGVAFLDLETDLWDIDFPELTDSERAEARVLLECAACRQQRVMYLTACEAEVLEFHNWLSFFCSRCVEATMWRPVSVRPSELQIASPEPSLPPTGTKNQRTALRTPIRLSVCLRLPPLGDEEVTRTENVSRGGFGFKTRKFYVPGTIMEVALPYAPGQANIFCPVEVKHCEPAGDQGWFTCGVSYIRAHRGWPGKSSGAVAPALARIAAKH